MTLRFLRAKFEQDDLKKYHLKALLQEHVEMLVSSPGTPYHNHFLIFTVYKVTVYCLSIFCQICKSIRKQSLEGKQKTIVPKMGKMCYEVKSLSFQIFKTNDIS